MSQKRLNRIVRTGKLTPEQVARDQEIRRKVLAEFPPLQQQPVSDSLSESLKKAIQDSPKSVYQLAQEAGVSQIMISRFLSGERDIRMVTADRLANVLGLKLASSIG